MFSVSLRELFAQRLTMIIASSLPIASTLKILICSLINVNDIIGLKAHIKKRIELYRKQKDHKFVAEGFMSSASLHVR